MDLRRVRGRMLIQLLGEVEIRLNETVVDLGPPHPLRRISPRITPLTWNSASTPGMQD
jgi:hypothetical protein